LYWDGDCRAALTAFDSLSNYAQKNDNLLFLKANCLLEAGRSEEAATLLENIIRNGRSRFTAQASWYLALSRLQTGRRKEAEVLLRRIAADAGSPRQADARSVLRVLK
jgi:thioredoxin-like negative regulator of GroEL